MPELNHLRTFLAIYRSGTLTRAARELSISQPAASAHLKLLEEEMGATLFVRRGRGVVPTSSGHALADEVGPPLDALSGVVRRLESATGREQEPVRLGGTAELMTGRVYPATAPLVAEGTRFVLRVDAVDPLLDGVADGRLDAAVVDREPVGRRLEAGRWFRDRAVMVSTPGWQIHGAPTTTLRARLAAVPLIGTAADDDLLRRHLREALGTELSTPPRMTVPSAVDSLAAAVAGCGLAVVPRFLARERLGSGALVEWAPPGEHLRLEYFVVTRDGALSDAVTAVVAALRAATTA